MARRLAFLKSSPDFVAYRAILGLLLFLLCKPAIAASDFSVANGNLYPGQLFLREYAPMVFEIADFNGDAAPDIVILGSATAGSFTAQAFMNDGAGGFAAGTTFPFLGLGSVIHVADVNGDDASDVLVKRYYSGEEIVSVLIGDGNGNLLVHGSHVLGSGLNRKLAAGDINGDGAEDIVWINVQTSGGRVLLSDGSGGFSNGQEFETADEPVDLEIADVNEDGWQDVLVIDDDPNVFSILMNDGKGILADAEERVTEAPVDGVAVDLDAEDVTGDGHVDIVIAASGGGIRLHSGNGSNFSYCWGPNSTIDMASVTLADIDGDAKSEVVAVTDRGIESWFGYATADQAKKDEFHVWGDEACDFYRGLHLRDVPRTMKVADVSRDGAPDFVTLGAAGLHIIAGNGRSHSARKEVNFGSGNSDVDLVDVTGDGNLDIIAANFEHNRVWVLAGRNAAEDVGSYTWQHYLGGHVGSIDWYFAGGLPMDVDAADVTGDEILDLVVANGDGDSISLLRGIAAGEFAADDEKFSTGDKPWVLEIADVTGDGSLDVLTGNLASRTVSLLENDGNGGFLAATEFAVTGEPRTLIVADVSGDENLDVVVGPGIATVLTGDGEGGFLPAVDHPAPGCAIFVTDFNGDGVSDVVCADDDGIRMVDIGEDGKTGTGASAPSTEAGRGFSLVDVNNDDALDVLSVDNDFDVVVVRLGDGAGGYLRELRFVTEEHPYDLAVGDMTGDGKLDVVTTHNNSADDGGFMGAVLLPQFNPAPVANSMEIRIDDAGQAYGTLSASDPGNEPLTFSVLDGPGTDFSFDDVSGAFTYSLKYDYIESNEFTFVAHDGTGHSNVALVKMYRNRAPVALDSTIEVEARGTAFGTMNASDPDGDQMTFSVVNEPLYGVVTIIDPATGAYRYESSVDSYDEFTFEVTDGRLKSNVATVLVSLLPKEEEPDPVDEGEDDGGEPDPIPPRSAGSQGGGSFGLAGLAMLAFFCRRRKCLTTEGA